MDHLRPAPAPAEFRPHQTELRLDSTRACKMFAAAVRNELELELSDLNSAGKPTAFEAIRAGLRGACALSSALPSDIKLLRQDDHGIHHISILRENSDSLTEMLKRDLLEYELDIVLSIRKSPTYLNRARGRTSHIKEVLRIKGERTKHYEDEQLRQQK